MERQSRDSAFSGLFPDWDWPLTYDSFEGRDTIYADIGWRYGERTAMEILHPFDRRREPRRPIDLPLVVWGVDTQGERFLQEANARDISLNGALLTGLDADLKSGDVIGILCGKRKARFRVIWIRYDGDGEKMQVAVHRIESDECPWAELLAADSDTNPTDGLRAPSP